MKDLPLVVILCSFLIIDFLTPSATRHVTQIVCKGAFDEEHNCKEVDRAGSDIELKINPAAQKVQITTTRTEGKRVIAGSSIMNCSVVDYDNWKCEGHIGSNLTTINAMWHGRYYSALVGGYTPDFNQSGLNGIPYWLHRYGILDFKTAVSWD